MKIASAESLELLLSKNSDNYYYISSLGSAGFDLIKENIPNDKIIKIKISKPVPIFANDEVLIGTSDITEKLEENKIRHFWLAGHSSKYIEKWGKNKKIHLLGSTWDTQKKFENKIFFEKLLQKYNLPSPASVIIKNIKNLSLIKKIPGVLQVPFSYGSQGTFFIKKPSDIKNIITEKKLKFPLLYREYIKGIPLGVTILIGKNKMIFSALRMQAFFPDKKEPYNYMGIQWVKNFHADRSYLNKELKRLGETFQKIGFTGVANVDFILSDGKIFIIECNPRLSGASAQLAYKRELFHGMDFIKEFIKIMTGKNLSKNKPHLPKSNYEGCTIDLDYLVPDLNKKNVKKICPGGIYIPQKGRLFFLSHNIKNFKKASSVLLYHILGPGINIKKDGLGIAMSHRPVFFYSNGKCEITENGHKILKYIKSLILR